MPTMFKEVVSLSVCRRFNIGVSFLFIDLGNPTLVLNPECCYFVLVPASLEEIFDKFNFRNGNVHSLSLS